MNRFYKLLIIILGLCLPWHGSITVFLPDSFRYWKEIVLILFFAVFFFLLLALERKYDIKKRKSLMDWVPRCLVMRKDLIFAGLFLFWGLILVIFSVDKTNAFLAFRYLGLGVFVYLLFSLISENYAKFREIFLKCFSLTFIYSCLIAVLFGTWIKFGNGAEITRNFYSQTISSWVPGQTIPLWHEVGGFIRMQGASSGPIEFSHLLLVALFVTLISRLKNTYKILFSAIFLWGIWQSFSRAAIFGAVLILLFHFVKKIKLTSKAKKKMAVVLLLAFFFAGFWLLSNTNILERAGTSDHFTRPVQAIKFGLENILSNNLGKLGPVARSQNLLKNNNDEAMIAENVFVDVFAQMGMIGILLYLIFFWYLFKNLYPKFRGFFIVAIMAMSLATIFDMTPIAISFFCIFFLAFKKKI